MLHAGEAFSYLDPPFSKSLDLPLIPLRIAVSQNCQFCSFKKKGIPVKILHCSENSSLNFELAKINPSCAQKIKNEDHLHSVFLLQLLYL